MTIKDAAERTGFSAPTLRYYEEIGLLPQSTRTPAGYRTCDEQTVDRSAFIARAKKLGCTLGEIGDLTTAWEGGRCGPVQDRLRSVVAEKLATAKHPDRRAHDAVERATARSRRPRTTSSGRPVR